ncbi:carbohydrate kinase [Clostridium sp.]|uniref:carbohydrate kinase family protein n=1 Tax=Clostridium sp. TaxID=1506 RepID=UPI00307CB9A6
MRIKTDITALGELLIDFTPAGVSQQGMRLFEQNPGGAPANLLAAAAKFGRKTAFIGKVGKDMHGDFLKETLIRAGINTDNLIQDEKYFTTLAFVSLKENGEREFAFARKPGADTNLCMKEIDPEILENTRVFHVGSLSLTDDPSRTATYEAINIARNSGAVISYDPNYRAALWSDPETAQLRMQSLIPYVDMMKISDEETSLLTPYQDPEEAIQYLLRQGVHLVAVTLGRDGALIGNENGIIKAEGFSSHAVDTTGAGDSFWGGFLASYLQEETSPEHLTRAQMIQFGRVGNAVASLCVERRGGISAIPEMEEIEESLRG